MTRPTRNAAKKASSILQTVQVLSDESASSFEENSPTKVESSESEGSAEQENFDIVKEFKISAAKGSGRDPSPSTLMFIDDLGNEPKVMVEDTSQCTPSVQKFSFHNPKYTPKLQLEECDFEKFQSAVLSQLSGVKDIGDLLHLNSINGRITCPLAKCDKTFLNYEGIKYHLTNFVHSFECLGLPESECELSPDYWPIAIPWLMMCKPRKKPSDFGFLFGLPVGKNEVDSKHSAKGKDISRLPLMTNQNVSVDKFHPSNMNQHYLPNLLTPSELSNTTVFYKAEKLTGRESQYFDFVQGGFKEYDTDSRSIENLPELSDLEFLIQKKSYKVKGYSSLHFQNPRPHFIVNCGIFVKCIEWIGKYLIVGGESDEISDGLLQIYKILEDKVELSMVIRHRYGANTSLKWCIDSHLVNGRFGFLVASFADGGVRVLDIPSPSERAFRNLEVEKPLFEFVPNGYGISCLAWENKNNWIACGTDHGKSIFDFRSYIDI